jgi:hypothetical protein
VCYSSTGSHFSKTLLWVIESTLFLLWPNALFVQKEDDLERG